jgi:transposase
MPQRFQRPYPAEFRREAVRLVEATGRRYQDVAVELGVSGESLRKWIAQEQADQGQRSDVLSSGERDELRRLRRQVRDLEAEREILKRAIEVSTDRGTSVEVWTISCDGVHVRASAPRLQVAEQMQLTARLSIDDLPEGCQNSSSACSCGSLGLVD